VRIDGGEAPIVEERIRVGMSAAQYGGLMPVGVKASSWAAFTDAKARAGGVRGDGYPL
jgi:hypothetical protein